MRAKYQMQSSADFVYGFELKLSNGVEDGYQYFSK